MSIQQLLKTNSWLRFPRLLT